MRSIEEINSALKKVAYPGFTKSIVDFGFVKKINVEGESVEIEVEITSSAPEVEEQIRAGVKDALNTVGVESYNLILKKPKMPKESSSKGKNIVPHIKNLWW